MSGRTFANRLGLAASLTVLVVLSVCALGCKSTGSPPDVLADAVLGCKNTGSHQDVAKEPKIWIESGSTLPKDTTITWKASDGDGGINVLDKELTTDPNDFIIGRGSFPGTHLWTCTAEVQP